MFRRHPRLAIGGGLLLLWLALAALFIFLGVRSAQTGFRQLDDAQKDRTMRVLLAADTSTALGKADGSFGRAKGWFDNPLLLPLRIVPVVGRQLNASRDLAGSARASVRTARSTVDQLRALTRGSAPKGLARVALVDKMGALARQAQAQLAAIKPGSGQSLLGPVRDAHEKFVTKRQEALDGLTRAQAVTAGLSDFLRGPSFYLLIGANNAEMRAGSGMWLSGAPLVATDGQLRIGKVIPTDNLILPKGTIPVGDADLQRNWSWLDPARDFRQLALTPRFGVTASIAQRMWAKEPGGGHVDGVVVIDVEGLRGLLRAVGPVTVDGVTYAAPTVEQQLLNGQYSGAVPQKVRKDRLGDVARAVFDRIEHGSWKAEDLATELAGVAQGRHLMIWSSKPVQQKAWQAASLDGEIMPNSLAVSLLNRGGNKLDYFLQQTVSVTTRPHGSGETDVTVKVDLKNPTPANVPSYVAGGPQALAGLQPGEYGGILVVNIPGSAGNVIVNGGAYSTLSGTDGPSQVRGVFLTVPRGGSTSVTVTFRLSGTHGAMVLEPSGRAPAASWLFQGRPFKAEYRRTVHW